MILVIQYRLLLRNPLDFRQRLSQRPHAKAWHGRLIVDGTRGSMRRRLGLLLLRFTEAALPTYIHDDAKEVSLALLEKDVTKRLACQGRVCDSTGGANVLHGQVPDF